MKIITKRRIVWLAIIALLAAYPVTQYVKRAQRVAQIEADKAEFDRICKDVAGYKIYKTVEDVEGIQLLKIRQKGKWGDPMAPGAAFSHEYTGDNYIKGFLLYETPNVNLDTSKTPAERYSIPLSPQRRGSFGLSPIDAEKTAKERGASPGYKYVDIFEGGVHYRVTSSDKVVGKKDVTAIGVQNELKKDPNYDLNIYQWSLDRTPTQEQPPRYAVTFEDYVIPEERARGFASSKVKVIDTQTNEVLGEMLAYAWTYISASSPENETPWLTAYHCPGNPNDGAHNTRAFVDQVLLPVGSIYKK